jgi:hypothetical protein
MPGASSVDDSIITQFAAICKRKTIFSQEKLELFAKWDHGGGRYAFNV